MSLVNRHSYYRMSPNNDNSVLIHMCFVMLQENKKIFVNKIKINTLITFNKITHAILLNSLHESHSRTAFFYISYMLRYLTRLSYLKYIIQAILPTKDYATACSIYFVSIISIYSILPLSHIIHM